MWTATWIAAVFLLALREFLLWMREGVRWYWRITERLQIMEDTRDELRAANATKKADRDAPAAFSWRADRWRYRRGGSYARARSTQSGYSNG